MNTALANTNSIDRIERKIEDHLSGRLCRNCRSLLEVGGYEGVFSFGDQVWTCNDCGQARKWGENRPWDQYAKPILNCEGCECSTRHQFLRVA
jgi:RNase P subunit RPR2